MGISPLSLGDIPLLGKGGKKQLHADWHGAVGVLRANTVRPYILNVDESLRHGFAVPPPFRQGRLFAMQSGKRYEVRPYSLLRRSIHEEIHESEFKIGKDAERK